MRKVIGSVVLTGLLAGACTLEPDSSEEPGVLNQPVIGKRFGTICQADFQNNWQVNLAPFVWDTCVRFNNRMDDTDTKQFYGSMVGAKSSFEDAGDQNWVEQVSLLFTDTHGGVLSDTAIAAMWDNGSFHETKNSYWGDESVGISLWAAYACGMLKIDSNTWTRWNRLMKGGLYAVAGSHDTVWASSSTDDAGENFAEELQAGVAYRYAWRNGIQDDSNQQDGMVMFSGNSSSDCSSRRSGITWQNVTSYTRRVNGSMTNLCWSYWDNIL
jgi:hypothetical protein